MLLLARYATLIDAAAAVCLFTKAKERKVKVSCAYTYERGWFVFLSYSVNYQCFLNYSPLGLPLVSIIVIPRGAAHKSTDAMMLAEGRPRAGRVQPRRPLVGQGSSLIDFDYLFDYFSWFLFV